LLIDIASMAPNRLLDVPAVRLCGLEGPHAARRVGEESR